MNYTDCKPGSVRGVRMMRDILSRYLRTRTIRFKLLMTYFLLVAAPIVIISSIFAGRLTFVVRENAQNQADLSASQIKQNVTQRLTNFYELTRTVREYTPIIGLSEVKLETDYELLQYYVRTIQPLTDVIENGLSSVAVRIFSEDQSIPFSRITNNSFDDLARYGFPPVSQLDSSGIEWFATRGVEGIEDSALCAYFMLRDPEQFSKPSAVIALFFDELDLFSFVSKEQEGNNAVFLVDDSDRIITTTQRSLLLGGEPRLPDGLAESVRNGKGGHFTGYKSNWYIPRLVAVEYPEINISGWSLVYLMNVNSVHRFISSVWITSGILCIGSVLLSFTVIYLLITSITARVSGLVRRVDSTKSGDFEFPSSSSTLDEFRILEDSFDSMFKRINHLVNSVLASRITRSKLETERREAELIALRSQMNPHFLFNALETVRMNLVSGGDEDNANIVKLIAANLRFSLGEHHGGYTLLDELRFVDNYVEIQRFRFKDRIRYRKVIAPDLLSVSIPELIIQPLVENSYYHGLERKVGGGEVLLDVRREGDRLLISVSDDGVGMTNTKRLELQQMVDGGADQHVGHGTHSVALRNIHSRLARMFGPALSFEIISEGGVGTTIRVSFPAGPLQQEENA
jgi:two-component system, sensor histidine kinase YesM